MSFPTLWGDEVAREVSGVKARCISLYGSGVSCLIINLRVMGQGGRRSEDIGWGQRREENGDGHMGLLLS